MPVMESTVKKISQYINAVLRLDSEFVASLVPLAGNTVRIIVLGLDLKLDVSIGVDGIDLLRADESVEANVEITGSPLALMGLLLSANMLPAMQTSEVYMKGDAQLAQQLSNLAGNLNIDWEELLAQKVGDIPAHQLGEWFRGLRQWRKRVHESLLMASGEYLQEEARHLPTRIETEHFMDAVDSLRDAVERLEARLFAMQEKPI